MTDDKDARIAALEAELVEIQERTRAEILDTVDDDMPPDRVVELAKLWRAGKLIGGDAHGVAIALLNELDRWQQKWQLLAGKLMERDAECIAERERREAALRVVHEQACDEGLWFHAQRVTEAYLQAALRRLHAAIEGEG